MKPTDRTACFRNSKGLRSTRRKQPSPEKQQAREKLPALPSTVGLLLSLRQHVRQQWVETPIQAPKKPCWANAALYVLGDIAEAYYRETGDTLPRRAA